MLPAVLPTRTSISFRSFDKSIFKAPTVCHIPFAWCLVYLSHSPSKSVLLTVCLLTCIFQWCQLSKAVIFDVFILLAACQLMFCYLQNVTSNFTPDVEGIRPTPHSIPHTLLQGDHTTEHMRFTDLFSRTDKDSLIYCSYSRQSLIHVIYKHATQVATELWGFIIQLQNDIKWHQDNRK